MRDQIPLYSADGPPFGYRTRDAALRLLESGYVKPVYGRKGHLKALFLKRDDGGNSVENHPRSGTRYSFREHLDGGGRCWKLRRVDGR